MYVMDVSQEVDAENNVIRIMQEKLMIRIKKLKVKLEKVLI